MVARLRRNSGLSLDDLAAASGLDRDALEHIEDGTVRPSLRSLWALARVFEVPFRLLVSDNSMHDKVFQTLSVADGRTIYSADGRFRSRALSAAEDPREPEIYEISLAPGCVEEAGAHPTETFEHIHVLRGRLRVRTAENDAVLRPGDTLFFRADVPHAYENAAPVETVALLTMTNSGDWPA